ncbi:DUF637 domain-containing protein [Vibrio coralliilyticus]|uniref:DUF637 domain-containing protein n=1 Tax=Vibrio coralliilyticus TaxID=190893 RepID=UPI00156050DC|nr:DUF637 domain-containing protein [Vibrio coralliilyticus]NRF31380.1 DUF637 domain-containing protein [Vibrio coralliilyticus]NRF54874.1 DUF637 domain-containing protein [Vibrio coralliilyticus]NRG06046.1 DUF637 domain-containing protein [Vibrio coralliilyticus]
MNKIKTPLWQKVTSNTLLAAFVTHLSFPVYASVKTNIALEEIEAAVTYTARYDLMESVDQYLYKGALESDELGIFDGFTYFSNLLSASNPELIPGYSAESGQPVDLTTLPARFGSPYVERGVIRHQITQLLNKSWISKPGYSSYNEQTKKLYENAVEVAKENGFQLGQRLTEQQIAALTRDIVWPEIRMIGEQSYLVPFVYLTPATIQEQQLLESTFAANSAEINTQTFVVNGSRVEFKHDALIDVEQDFINTQGHVSGQKFTIRTGRELQNLSGTITGDDVTLIANKLANDTLVTRLDYGHGFSETFNQIGTISTLGNLNIYTSGDVVSHGGQFSSQGSLEIESGGNIILVPQEDKDQRAESGQRWSDSESSLVNLQTSLSAVDTLSLIAGGQVFIQGAKLESQGLLQILAGYGITLKSAADLRSYERKFEAESGGMFGTKESESESATEAEIVRTLLKAGQSMLLSTEKGNVLLEAVTIDNKGMSKIIAENGSIDFELAKLLETYSHEQSFEGSLSFRHQGNGYQREVAYYSEFINNGGLLLDGAHGVRIQIASGSKNLDQIIADLAQTPELAWMQDIRNNPEYSHVDWDSIELVMEEWDYDQSGLTPAAMAILSVVMAIASGGTSLAATGTVTATTALNTAIGAGIAALETQVAASLLANGFDIKDTLEQLASDESLTSLATTMVTAGVLSGLDIPLFSGDAGASQSLNDILGNVTNETLVNQAITQLVHTSVSTGVSAIANGHSIEEFGDAFVQSIAMSAVMHIGKDLANKIGIASRVQEGQTEPDINTATQYIAHAALGCGLGTAISSINGGNSSANRNGCASGAAGGVIGEYVAQQYKAHTDVLKSESEEFVSEVFEDLRVENPTLSNKELSLRYEQELLRLQQQGVDISRLAAGITVFAFGGNTDIAISTGGNAAQHNAFFVIPALLIAVKAAMAAATIYDIGETIYQLYRILNGDAEINITPEQAVINLLTSLGVRVVTKGINKIPLDKLPFDELMELAKSALLGRGHAQYATALGSLEKNFQKDAKGNAVASGSAPSSWYKKPVGMSEEDYGKYLTHKNLAPYSKFTPEQVVEKLKTHDYEPDRGHGTWVKKDLKIKRHSATPVEKIYDDNWLNLNDEIKVKGLKKPVTVKEATERRQELLEQSRLAENDPNVRKPSPSEINVFSEALGEMRAKKYAADNDLGEELANKIPGSKQSNFVFDQVYVKDGRVSILDAKGSISESPSLSGHTLGQNKFMQGTQEYFNSIMTHMEKATRGLAPDHPYRKTYDAIELARESGQLDYKMVVQTISPATGELGNTLVKTYDIK